MSGAPRSLVKVSGAPISLVKVSGAPRSMYKLKALSVETIKIARGADIPGEGVGGAQIPGLT